MAGPLWESVLRASDRALRSGALRPIPTEREIVEDAGVRFVVRRFANLERKERAAATTPGNPFLPYEPDMFVADVMDTHVALLNRFNVVEHHLLVVTRRFEHQDTLLTEADFEALLACMDDYDSLGFYNAGTIAGASQPHKHLQLIPLPMDPDTPPVPIEPALASLPFRHASHRGRASHFAYRRLLDSAGITGEGQPYNLLVTRDWMLLVPRSREFCGTISLNAIAFAGGLLVRDDEEMRLLKSRGPMAALTEVGFLPGSG